MSPVGQDEAACKAMMVEVAISELKMQGCKPAWTETVWVRLQQSEEKIPKTVMPKELPMPIACVKYLQTACWLKFSFLWILKGSEDKPWLNNHDWILEEGTSQIIFISEIKDDGALATHSVVEMWPDFLLLG